MKRLISYICTIAMFIAMSTVAYADEVNSPSVSFITTTNEDGTYTVTLNWEKTTLQAFEYSVVYDADKVTVKSAKLTGEFLSPYLGDGKYYSGIAIANDNGGYVALGGVVEAQDPTKIPEYEGAIARIIFAPKESQGNENGGSTTPAPDGSQNVDMGSIKLVNGVSEYASADEIKQKADTEPVVAFDLAGATDGEPITANASGTDNTDSAAGSDAQAQDSQTGDSAAQSTEQTGSSAETTDAGAVVTEEVTSDSLSDDAVKDVSAKSTDAPKKDKTSGVNVIVIILAVAGCAVIVAIAVGCYRKKQGAASGAENLEDTEGVEAKEESSKEVASETGSDSVSKEDASEVASAPTDTTEDKNE